MYLTWTTSLLLSDPEGSYWHRTPTRARPITPIISLNDVKCATYRAASQQDEKEPKRCFLIVLVYGGAYRIRTDDILLAKQALYQLS